MKYKSTRGGDSGLSFEDVIISGLAGDGGLYMPEKWPEFSPAEISAMAKLSYPDLALRVIEPFVAGTIPREDLKRLLDETYSTGVFRHAAIAPLKQLGQGNFLLELFHGPTIAFKDFALQLLGRLMDYYLDKRGINATVLGATSGDTGSAAIAGCLGCERVRIFILYPDGKVSDVQRKQMTCVDAPNVHNIALRGNFDDCQNIVKELFSDADFKKRHNLLAVNSINWARIMAQAVYYFYAALALGAPAREPVFVVPSGNFGNIFAGYVAAKMGLPIARLVIATNKNDILHRFMQSGAYEKKEVAATLAPSMDIQISSNFERLLFDSYEENPKAIAALFEQLKGGGFKVSEEVYRKISGMFASHKVTDDEIIETIGKVYANTGELLDPHSAIGVRASWEFKGESPVVTLGTAHPAKFPDAVKRATGVSPALPPEVLKQIGGKERYKVVENEAKAVKGIIEPGFQGY